MQMRTDGNRHRRNDAITPRISPWTWVACTAVLISAAPVQASSVSILTEQSSHPSGDIRHPDGGLDWMKSADKNISHKIVTGNNKHEPDKFEHGLFSPKSDGHDSSGDKHGFDDSERDHVSIDWNNHDSWKFPYGDDNGKPHEGDHHDFLWSDDDSKFDKHGRWHHEHHGDWDKDDYCHQPAPVPVPPAAWLFGSGLLGLIGVARRRAS